MYQRKRQPLAYDSYDIKGEVITFLAKDQPPAAIKTTSLYKEDTKDTMANREAAMLGE